MEYKKPVIVAQNNKTGSFAAGCPDKGMCGNNTINGQCAKCDRAK